MDGTFTASSQSDLSPLSGGILLCLLLLFYLTAVTLSEMRLNCVSFPPFAFTTDAFDNLKLIFKEFFC